MAQNDEAKHVIDCCVELIKLYDQKKDFQRIANINKFYDQIQQTIEKQQAELTQIANDLNEKIKKVEAEAQRVEPPEEHKKRMEMMYKTLGDIQMSITNTEIAIKQFGMQVEEIEKKIQKTDAQYKKQKLEYDKAIPTMRSKHCLYVSIAPIEWDADSTNAKGYITKKNDVRYFNFPRNMDDFAICNKLWDMLGQEA